MEGSAECLVIIMPDSRQSRLQLSRANNVIIILFGHSQELVLNGVEYRAAVGSGEVF